MSALLSPPRRLRARFTVPGEGSYELSADVPPPTPRPPPPPPAKPPPPPLPGPLGLPTVTKLAFATDAAVRPPDHPDHEPLFSFRKLTAFTSLTAKFAADDDHPPSQPAQTSPSTPSAVLAYNAADTVYLLDVANPTEELFSLAIRTTPTALAITAVDGLRLLVGTASGEVVYYPDLSERRRATTSLPQSCVYNKDGSLSSSRVVAVKWLPNSAHKFLSLHLDGALIVYDDRMKPSALRPDDNARAVAADERPDRERLRVGLHDVHVTNVKGKRSNPATVLHIGRTSLTDCSFAPSINPDSASALATTARDGYLRIIHFNNQHISIAFRSYFGALLCVAWSPDGKYVATGGEDDLVSIFSPSEERLVARLEGHTSWVSAVAWDHACNRPGTYRLGSAGQDAKLLLWDFDLETLHHPQRNSMTRRRSYRETNGMSNGERRQSKISRLRGHTQDPEPHYPLIVPAPGRAEVPLVEPLVAHVAHGEPLTDVWFLDGGVFTADAVGGVKMWSRPPQHAVPELSLGKGGSRAATDLD
ncbi:putative catabolite repression protein creC [Gracilariopsis chorda]|uniref:Putative catabolite repression protein creC n=1 Tax=Gracilariopsis chorda TaxID=448386 RepID=A0A2V3IYF4_9FLOR|nr:putative catabolite repression protein creC [Gracilariopsis chorda]|eukprot:PXF47139.1 putative catabolite repression protein creC [Gracilariopsis chorda]